MERGYKKYKATSTMAIYYMTKLEESLKFQKNDKKTRPHALGFKSQ